MQGVRFLWYQTGDEISPEVVAGTTWHLNVSTDQVSVVVKDTLYLLLAHHESVDVSAWKKLWKLLFCRQVVIKS